MSDMEKGCDREELIAAYLDRMLPVEERLEFEKHLATCDACLMELISAKSELGEITSEMAVDAAVGERRSLYEHARPSRFSTKRAHSGGSPVIQAAFSSCAAILFAVLFMGAMLSYRLDPGFKEGAYLLDRLLEVRETGPFLLSNGASRPGIEINTVRGNRRLHVGLSLDTGERLKRTLARYPENAYLLSALGQYHMADGRPDIALIYLERALEIRPDDARILNDLAAALYRKGSFGEAENLLLRAEKGEETPPEVLYNLGVLYGERGDRDLQIEYIQRFLESAPDSPRSDEARRMLEE